MNREELLIWLADGPDIDEIADKLLEEVKYLRILLKQRLLWSDKAIDNEIEQLQLEYKVHRYD